MSAVSSVVESLRRLDDLVRPQAPRADAHPLDAPVDHRPHRLKVRLEPPRADVVRVAMLTAHHGTLSANLASLGHISLSALGNRVIEYVGN